MSVLSGSVQGNAQPGNVSSGDLTVTVTGTHACGNTVQPFVLDDSLLTATPPLTQGRWVLLRANSITGYVGATVTPPTGLSVYSVSQEAVNYSGTNYQCIVVTLI